MLNMEFADQCPTGSSSLDDLFTWFTIFAEISDCCCAGVELETIAKTANHVKAKYIVNAGRLPVPSRKNNAGGRVTLAKNFDLLPKKNNGARPTHTHTHTPYVSGYFFLQARQSYCNVFAVNWRNNSRSASPNALNGKRTNFKVFTKASSSTQATRTLSHSRKTVTRTSTDALRSFLFLRSVRDTRTRFRS